MNGPEHYREGERQLQEAYDHADTPQAEFFHLTAAQNHFLAALVACLAEDRCHDSVSWQQAVGW